MSRDRIRPAAAGCWRTAPLLEAGNGSGQLGFLDRAAWKESLTLAPAEGSQFRALRIQDAVVAEGGTDPADGWYVSAPSKYSVRASSPCDSTVVRTNRHFGRTANPGGPLLVPLVPKGRDKPALPTFDGCSWSSASTGDRWMKRSQTGKAAGSGNRATAQRSPLTPASGFAAGRSGAAGAGSRSGPRSRRDETDG
jgi:hypothetical protein